MNSNRLILDNKVLPADSDLLGSVAKPLWQLERAGFTVPAWLCVPSSLYLKSCQQIRPLLADLEPGEFARQGQALLAEFFPQDLVLELEQQLDPQGFYAVRPSFVDPDGCLFRAPLSSWLQLPASEVARHVLFCWQSTFEPATLVWLHEQNYLQVELKLAVLIQKMVKSESSGMLFMANPVGALTEVVINAAYGLAQGLKSGQIEADTYLYDQLQQQWSERIVVKRFQIGPAHLGGTERLLVPDAQQLRAVLDAEQCQTLLELGQAAQQMQPESAALELEWALDQRGRFWLLQARELPGVPRGEENCFDQRLLAERFPGLTAPLSFDWAQDYYSQAVNGVLNPSGVSAADKTRTDAAELFGHLQGRIYANLSAWKRLAESGLGQFGLHIPLNVDLVSDLLNKPFYPLLGPNILPQILIRPVLWRLFKLYSGLKKELQSLERHLESLSAEVWTESHASNSAHKLLRRLKYLRQEVVPAGRLEILLKVCLLGWQTAVFQLLRQAGFSYRDAEALCHDLLCDAAGNQSLEPVHSLLALASEVRREPALKAFLNQQLKAYDPQALEAAYPAFMSLWLRHLEHYGDRALGELKLETVTQREDPRLLCQSVLDYAASPLTTASLNTRERLLRQDAESRLQAESQLPAWLKPVLKLCLNQARGCLIANEHQRQHQARIFGLVRHLVNRLGESLSRTGLLARPKDVFWLSLTELETIVYGSGIQSPDWNALITQRHQQYQLWSQLSVPERVLCRGPFAQNRIPAQRAAGQSRRLLGLGCSAGVVSAEAVVVADPAEARDLKGKILVAEMTDPGWAFLMIQAAGLIVENGNLYSYTANIGRELGIPTIVGVSEATRQIYTGQRLSLNGQTGEVEFC